MAPVVPCPLLHTRATLDAIDFQLHARLLGGVVNREADLLPSSMIGVLFGLISGGLAWRWRRAEASHRPTLLLVCAIGLFSTSLSSIIRAGASNTSPAHLAAGTIIADQITLVIGTACFIDAVVTLSRDIMLLAPVDYGFTNQASVDAALYCSRPRLMHSGRTKLRFTILARVLLIISVLLSAVGFLQIKSTNLDQSIGDHKTNLLRLFGAMIPLLIVFLNMLFFVFIAIKYRPWIREEAFSMPMTIALVIVVSMNLLIFVPTLYPFILIAVADDDAAPVTSKLFFYLACASGPRVLLSFAIRHTDEATATDGIFQGFCAVILVALDMPRYVYPHPYFALRKHVG